MRVKKSRRMKEVMKPKMARRKRATTRRRKRPRALPKSDGPRGLPYLRFIRFR